MKRLFARGGSFLTGPQNTILAAAAVIMVMVVFSSVLGLIRLRIFAHFFEDRELALLFASFRLPDLVFQLLAFGVFSSALIPVFTKVYSKNKKLAFETAARLCNVALLGFIVFGSLFAIFGEPIYSVFTPGFAPDDHAFIAALSRILLVTQGIFIVSYILTGVLESLRRFFITALAPIFYNIGIITTTVLFADSWHLYAPAAGAVFGAILHLLVQLPSAYKLGFRFTTSLGITEEVKKIGKLSAPRLLELSFLQVSKLSELFFASLIATAALTYYTFADSVRVMPVTLFGVSLAKAALPTLARYDGNRKKFKKAFLTTLYQIIFFVMPITAILVVLRIPVVRLLFGTARFDWEATVQTGLVLSVFALSIPFQSAAALLSRAFYARHNTRTPVKISMLGVVVTVLLSAIFILVLGLPTWGLALAYTIGISLQAILLYFILSRQLNGGTLFAVVPIIKSVFASVVAGGVMYFLIKFFDRYNWIKQLSFIGDIPTLSALNFENFVLDTRYTSNLLILTCITAVVGGLVYLTVSYLLKSKELTDLINILRKRKFSLPKDKEEEPLTRSSGESNH